MAYLLTALILKLFIFFSQIIFIGLKAILPFFKTNPITYSELVLRMSKNCMILIISCVYWYLMQSVKLKFHFVLKSFTNMHWSTEAIGILIQNCLRNPNWNQILKNTLIIFMKSWVKKFQEAEIHLFYIIKNAMILLQFRHVGCVLKFSVSALFQKKCILILKTMIIMEKIAKEKLLIFSGSVR